MIKRRMKNIQKKGGKRDLVKKATGGLMVATLATGVVMNANVVDAHAEESQYHYSVAKPLIYLEDEVVAEAKGDQLESSLKEFLSSKYVYNEKLNYGRYKKVISFNLTKEEEGLAKAQTTIVNLLNYHGSGQFYVNTLEYNVKTKIAKVLVAFSPDRNTDVDKDGYADKLNLNVYTKEEMKALENRYVSTIGTIGYDVVNYQEGHERVDNLSFRRNLDNGYKQYEYDHIMKVIDNYIAKNEKDSDKTFSLKVWENPKTKYVCVTVYVDKNSGSKDEQVVDSEQAALLRNIKTLKDNYAKEKAASK